MASYYTDKVFSPKFLERSTCLDDMLVRKVEEGEKDFLKAFDKGQLAQSFERSYSASSKNSSSSMLRLGS